MQNFFFFGGGGGRVGGVRVGVNRDVKFWGGGGQVRGDGEVKFL